MTQMPLVSDNNVASIYHPKNKSSSFLRNVGEFILCCTEPTAQKTDMIFTFSAAKTSDIAKMLLISNHLVSEIDVITNFL